MYVNRVVFPAPRKPEINVTGMVRGGEEDIVAIVFIIGEKYCSVLL